MLVPHVSSKIICPLDSMSSHTQASINWTVNTVIVMNCLVVPIEGLFCLEGSMPGAIQDLAGKSARGASMRATKGDMGTC